MAKSPCTLDSSHLQREWSFNIRFSEALNDVLTVMFYFLVPFFRNKLVQSAKYDISGQHCCNTIVVIMGD